MVAVIRPGFTTSRHVSHPRINPRRRRLFSTFPSLRSFVSSFRGRLHSRLGSTKRERESSIRGERSSYFYDSLPHKHPPSYGLFATTMMLGSWADFTGDLRGKISDYKSTSACTHIYIYIYLRGYACFFFTRSRVYLFFA